MFWNSTNSGWYGRHLDTLLLSLRNCEYSSIPGIFCVFAECYVDAKEHAAKALGEALAKMTFSDLVRVDEHMRDTTSIEWNINWGELSVGSFFTPKMSQNERCAVIVFASFSLNGFIREQAVQLMKEYPGTLAFSILRQNDWVRQVKTASVETTRYRLAHLSKGELLFALPFVDKLRRSGRVQNPNSELVNVLAALAAKDNEDDLVQGLSNESVRTRRICMDALFAAEMPRFDLAYQRLHPEADPFLRAGFFRRLISSGQNVGAVTELLFNDKYPLNRMLAFQYICDNDKDAASQKALELLLDKNAVVRNASRSYLVTQNVELDYCDFYKSNLSKKTVPAILGLGETGKADDAAMIFDYLNSPLASAVRAAMIALMRLDSPKYMSLITEFLADERTSVARTAQKIITKYGSINYARVMEIFKSSKLISTKKICFAILLTASKWQRLIYIFEVLETSGTELVETANAALEHWLTTFNRSYAAVSNVEKQNIVGSLARLTKTLPDKARKELLFLLS